MLAPLPITNHLLLKLVVNPIIWPMKILASNNYWLSPQVLLLTNYWQLSSPQHARSSSGASNLAVSGRGAWPGWAEPDVDYWWWLHLVATIVGRQWVSGWGAILVSRGVDRGGGGSVGIGGGFVRGSLIGGSGLLVGGGRGTIGVLDRGSVDLNRGTVGINRGLIPGLSW